MADGDPANVFAFPDFDQSSKWLTLSPRSNSEFFNSNLRDSGQPTEDYITVQPANADVDGFFKLPASLVPTDLDKPSNAGHQDVSIPKPLHDVDLHDFEVYDDSWLQKDEPATTEAEYKTWDAFLNPDITQAAPIFITEAGPGAYDAGIKNPEDPLSIRNTKDSIVQTHPYLTALLALAFGRGSVFFVWDEEKKSFVPDMKGMRISGYSSYVLRGLQRHCLECGNTTRLLSAFVQVTYKAHPGAVRVAVAKTIDVTLLTIQKVLGAKARQIQSLLQLQSAVQPIRSLLAYFKSLIVKVSRKTTDEQALTLVFEEAQALEHGDALLSGVMREVLSRVSEPWIQFAEKWIGIRAEGGIPLTKENPGNCFVRVENVSLVDDVGLETEEPDYVLDENRMPEFFPTETASVMFETGKTLRLLRTHHPEHPLCQMGLITSSRPPHLQWHYDWKSIQRSQEDVKNYEKRLLISLRQGSLESITAALLVDSLADTSYDGYDLQFFGHEEAQLEGRLLASIKALNGLPIAVSEDDSLSRLLYARLHDYTPVTGDPVSCFSPHWSVIPYHSFGPLVATQARIINREYMRLLFTAHHLKDHLSLQKQFQLLGNGVFCSRLSHALFDPNLETTERQKGVALSGGVMGLRLGRRDNWPPASSELRLALMGVLTESYLLPHPKGGFPADGKRDLPGDISFAVRDLSAEEIDKCLNPGSLEALDFLRLSYKPPLPLSSIFTPVILLKYDRVFKLLLRVLRILFVSGQLFRDTLQRTSNRHHIDNASLRFRFEAHHFVSSISAYFFDTGIEMPWKQFEAWLGDVEIDLTRSELNIEERRVPSLDELREEHERMLDRIMHTLLLRKRQQPVMKLLEDIFTLMLKFSEVARLEASGKGGKEARDSSYKSLYDAFRKKVDVFKTVCHGLIEKGGHTEKPTRNDLMTNYGRHREGIKEENTIDRLLIKLEMSGYYASSRT
ncbi:Spc97/Spc98 family protein [Hypoxylon sp. NC1633]|nr:Spc97/Spc98 family protein [Hypoxylon sp. NC1633]